MEFRSGSIADVCTTGRKRMMAVVQRESILPAATTAAAAASPPHSLRCSYPLLPSISGRRRRQAWQAKGAFNSCRFSFFCRQRVEL